ncbi:MAG: N-acetylneuraminate synthase family protein [Candidatus Deferrimicrobium sp.]
MERTEGASGVVVGGRTIGDAARVYVIAEVGINHNGSVDVARKLVDGAVFAGCDAVKFQKRTPEMCVPRDQWGVRRETPWGPMSYIEYRRRMEFGADEFDRIDRHCRERGIAWFASCWDEESVRFMERYDPPLHKAPSASLTDLGLLRSMRATGRPLMLSTGMSTMEEIEAAVEAAGIRDLLVAHSTSTYPCAVNELNLLMIPTLEERFPCIPVGYSGHEPGLAPTWAAVALGARFVERHVTLDRSMWGTDQAASVEVLGLYRLVQNIRDIERAMGTGVKTVYESEKAVRAKLRRIASAPDAAVRA